MFHPNLSERLNRLVSAQIRYRDMQVGDLIMLEGRDARSGNMGMIAVRVIGFTEETDPAPIFQFLQNDFFFYAEDRKTPVHFPEGTLARAGVSATLIPEFVASMVGLGGIEAAGRDYSFEYVNGESYTIFLHEVCGIIKRSDENTLPIPPAPSEILKEYKTKVANVRAEREKARRDRQEQWKRPMMVRTMNSVYELGESNPDDGVRTIRKRGDPAEKYLGILRVLHVGSSMVCDLLDPMGKTLISSTVREITPM